MYSCYHMAGMVSFIIDQTTHFTLRTPSSLPLRQTDSNNWTRIIKLTIFQEQKHSWCNYPQRGPLRLYMSKAFFSILGRPAHVNSNMLTCPFDLFFTFSMCECFYYYYLIFSMCECFHVLSVFMYYYYSLPINICFLFI